MLLWRNSFLWWWCSLWLLSLAKRQLYHLCMLSSAVHEILYATFYWLLGKRQSTSKQLVECRMNVIFIHRQLCWLFASDKSCLVYGLLCTTWLHPTQPPLHKLWKSWHSPLFADFISQYVHPAISIFVLFPIHCCLWSHEELNGVNISGHCENAGFRLHSKKCKRTTLENIWVTSDVTV